MEDISLVKKRLLELCSFLGISPDQFSKNIGKNREYIRKITKEIGSDALRQIYLAYSDVNILWIITGEGEMLLSEEKKEGYSLYYEKKVDKLQNEIARLNRENGILEGKLEMLSGNSSKVV
jgi:predicted RNA-binding protein with PIN domain